MGFLPDMHGKSMNCNRKTLVLVIAVAVLVQGLVFVGWQTLIKKEDIGKGYPAAPPYLTIFLIDGLHHETYQHAMSEGAMPNLQAMIDEGVYVENGVTSFPSMTAYGFFPFITGRDASASGIGGLRWFDRTRTNGQFRNYVGRTNKQLNADLDKNTKTIFEFFPEEHSYSIQCYADRGAQVEVQKAWGYTTAKYGDVTWYFKLLSAIPVIGRMFVRDWIQLEESVIAEAIADLNNSPKIQWITFASPDGHMHVNGIDAKYPEIVRAIDKRIGEYRAASQEMGQEQERYYIVASDHGVTNVTRNFDIGDYLHELHGYKVDRDVGSILFSSELTKPRSAYRDVDMIGAINGNNVDYVYVRDVSIEGDEAWEKPPSLEMLTEYPSKKLKHEDGTPTKVNLLDVFADMPAVELVVFRNVTSMSVGIQRAMDGVMAIGMISAAYSDVLGEIGYRYTVISGGDPLVCTLDANCMALLDGQFHSADEWLAATYASAYPYAVVRLYRFMMNSGVSAPDLVLTSHNGYDFGRDFEPIVPNYRGGHGGARFDQMRVPYIMVGPSIRKGVRLPFATPEDIGATLFTAFDLPLSKRSEGKCLFDALDPDRRQDPSETLQ